MTNILKDMRETAELVRQLGCWIASKTAWAREPREKMANIKEVIKRARELAKLREKATPGPWEVKIIKDYPCLVLAIPHLSGSGAATIDRRFIHDRSDANAHLIAVAPEMAELLERMADELEKLIEEG